MWTYAWQTLMILVKIFISLLIYWRQEMHSFLHLNMVKFVKFLLSGNRQRRIIAISWHQRSFVILLLMHWTRIRYMAYCIMRSRIKECSWNCLKSTIITSYSYLRSSTLPIKPLARSWHMSFWTVVTFFWTNHWRSRSQMKCAVAIVRFKDLHIWVFSADEVVLVMISSYESVPFELHVTLFDFFLHFIEYTLFLLYHAIGVESAAFFTLFIIFEFLVEHYPHFLSWLANYSRMAVWLLALKHLLLDQCVWGIWRLQWLVVFYNYQVIIIWKFWSWGTLETAHGLKVCGRLVTLELTSHIC